MSFEISCTNCGQSISVADSAEVSEVNCPGCQTINQISEIHEASLVETPTADVALSDDRSADIPTAGFAGFDGKLGYYDQPQSPYQATDQQATIKLHEVYPRKEISPDIVQIGTVLTTAWDRTFSNLGTLLLMGLIWSVCVVVPVGLAPVGLALLSFDSLQWYMYDLFGVLEPSTTLELIIFSFLLLFSPLFLWLGCGAIQLGLKICRNQEVELREIISGSRRWPSLLAVAVVYLAVSLVFMFLWFYFEYPSPFSLFESLEPSLSLSFALDLMLALLLMVILLSIPSLIPLLILMRYILAPFLIIEREMTFRQAMRKSADLMVGNKMIVFSIGCVTQIIFTAALPLTLGIAVILLIPYWIITASTVYLFITGQILPARGY